VVLALQKQLAVIAFDGHLGRSISLLMPTVADMWLG